MANTKQLKNAFETLIGTGATKPVKKPLHLEVKPTVVPQEDTRVLTWEDMDIEVAKKEAEAFSMDEQLQAMEDGDAFAGVMDSAKQMHTQAEEVFKDPILPATLTDPSLVRTALGPAWPKLVHFSDSAVEQMAEMVQQNGRGRVYLTHITDEAVGLVTPKNSPLIGAPSEIEDTMRAYDFDRGYPYVPRLPATVDAKGDVVIKPPHDQDAQPWNALVSMAGMSYSTAHPKYFPLALDFDKPLFEYSKLSGVVKMLDDNGKAHIVSGINTNGMKRGVVPKKLVPSNSEWVDKPLADLNDAKARVNILFDENSGKGAYWVAEEGLHRDPAKLRGWVWEQHVTNATKRAMPAEHEDFFRRGRQSYWPKDEADQPMFDNWFPKGSDGRQAILDYTKDGLYKARLVDSSAPKDAPLIIARGTQGTWEFVDETGKQIENATMDPRLAKEFGLNAGSLAQAEHFALQGAVRQVGRFPPYRREYQRVQEIGTRIVNMAIKDDPLLKQMWDTFLDDLIATTNWGKPVPADGYADSVYVVNRPKHGTIENVMLQLIRKPEYLTLMKAIRKSAGSPQDLFTAMSIVKRGNADIRMFVSNATRPLMLWDTGGFSTTSIIRQLMEKEEFIDEMPQLTEAMRASDEQFLNEPGFSNIANTQLRRILERKGYDHIAYINTMEFPGTPSFIFWKKDSLRSVESFGVPKEHTKLLMGPAVAVGLAFGIGGEEEKEDGPDT